MNQVLEVQLLPNFVNNNFVLWSEDTSKHNTNYIWDGWTNGFLKSLVGKHMIDVKKLCNEYFNWYYNQGKQNTIHIL